jgi:hypothetical protein
VSRGFVASIIGVGAVITACSTTANISDVFTSLDGDGSRRRETFFTDTEEVHCIAVAGVGRPDVTVEGSVHQIRTFNFDKGDFELADRYIAFTDLHPQVEKDQKEPTKLDFLLEKTDSTGKPSDTAPYLAGSYVCEVGIDGKVDKTAAFNIDFPPCPSAEIILNGPCFGFYPKDQKCPRYGLQSSDGASCTCTTDKGWDCR